MINIYIPSRKKYGIIWHGGSTEKSAIQKTDDISIYIYIITSHNTKHLLETIIWYGIDTYLGPSMGCLILGDGIIMHVSSIIIITSN